MANRRVSEAWVARWREALLLPGEADLVLSSLRELAEYFGMSPAEARRACEGALADSKREWNAAARQTPDQVVDFYDNTQSYIFEHIWWHAVNAEKNSANVVIANYALQSGASAYLDFGSGVGANGILFARHGFSVTLADVSRTMLDFARWRFERRGLQAEYVYLREEPLPGGRFDIVTAVDVFEHLLTPATEIRQIAAALKVGGVMVFNICAGADPERPMHILKTKYPVLRALRRHGFRYARSGVTSLRRLGYHAVERGSQPPKWDLAWGLYDRLRYGHVAEAARRLPKNLFAPRSRRH